MRPPSSKPSPDPPWIAATTSTFRLRQRRRIPLAARHDLPVHGDGQAAGPSLVPAVLTAVATVASSGRIAASPLSRILTGPPPEPRRRGPGPPRSAAVRRGQVHLGLLSAEQGRHRLGGGREEHPVAVVPRRKHQTRVAAEADHGRVVRGARAQPRARLHQLQLGDLRRGRPRAAAHAHRPLRRCRTRGPPSSRRRSSGRRAEVPADAGSPATIRSQGAAPPGLAQGEDLSLHRAHRRPLRRRQPIGDAAPGPAATTMRSAAILPPPSRVTSQPSGPRPRPATSAPSSTSTPSRASAVSSAAVTATGSATPSPGTCNPALTEGASPGSSRRAPLGRSHSESSPSSLCSS